MEAHVYAQATLPAHEDGIQGEEEAASCAEDASYGAASFVNAEEEDIEDSHLDSRTEEAEHKHVGGKHKEGTLGDHTGACNLDRHRACGEAPGTVNLVACTGFCLDH
jgi:hypothetical protein